MIDIIIAYAVVNVLFIIVLYWRVYIMGKYYLYEVVDPNTLVVGDIIKVKDSQEFRDLDIVVKEVSKHRIVAGLDDSDSNGHYSKTTNIFLKRINI